MKIDPALDKDIIIKIIRNLKHSQIVGLGRNIAILKYNFLPFKFNLLILRVMGKITYKK
jgi:hypothetical protein